MMGACWCVQFVQREQKVRLWADTSVFTMHIKWHFSLIPLTTVLYIKKHDNKRPCFCISVSVFTIKLKHLTIILCHKPLVHLSYLIISPYYHNRHIILLMVLLLLCFSSLVAVHAAVNYVVANVVVFIIVIELLLWLSYMQVAMMMSCLYS